MSFNPAWNEIGCFDRPVPPAVIKEVTALLFASDPPEYQLSEVALCLVLGSRNCGYKAQRAAELFGMRDQVRFIVCGANRTLSGLPEAELLQEVLLTNGVSKNRILLEEHSTNTVGNLQNAEQLVKSQIPDPGDLSIAVLSSAFHRRHVLASLPPSLGHAIFVNATGPSAGMYTWHMNPLGRAAILHELKRPGFATRHREIGAEWARPSRRHHSPKSGEPTASSARHVCNL